MTIVFQIKQYREKTAGFTLVETTIAVAVISLLLVTSYPAFSRAKISANEASAQKGLLTFRDAFVMFQISDPNFSYPANFSILGDLVQGFSSSSDSSVTVERHGYTYTLSNVTQTTYTITAQPTQSGVTGERTFVIDQNGAVKLVDDSVTGNLADDWSRLNPSGFKRGYGHSEYEPQKGVFKLFWNYTNFLGQVIDNVIIAIERTQFGGAALGAKLISDGKILKSAKSDEKVDYYHIGQVEKGQKVEFAEELRWDKPVNGGWWYARSINAYAQKKPK